MFCSTYEELEIVQVLGWKMTDLTDLTDRPYANMAGILAFLALRQLGGVEQGPRTGAIGARGRRWWRAGCGAWVSC